jgi:type II secretory pathway predicted ATPase ExeA
MYERFYGLTRTPFAVTPDPAMLFMSKVHREALATIIYGVETRKGFIVCTGEVGTGKSTIVRAFFDQMHADAVKLIYIFTPQVSPLEMSQYVCRELGLDDPNSVFAAMPRLQLKLLEEFESGRTVVLMIDEAQLLPTETLEFLRLLSNFETDTEKLIQIVLVGQPEVDTMLARRDMRQVNQRVALRARLEAFSLEESFDYIEHRLRVSGAEELAQVMTPSAGWLIAEAAGGIPRVINILADNALIAGFGMAQRPLGSQLAGTTVREFLGKSEAATPVRGERFAAGWRAIRRLRSALAQDKGEPVEWVAAAPPPPAANVRKAPVRGNTATRGGGTQVLRLGAPDASLAGSGSVQPVPVAPPAALASSMPASAEMAGTDRVSPRVEAATVEPAPVRAEAVPIVVEPVDAQPEAVAEVGEPVAAFAETDTIIVEPVPEPPEPALSAWDDTILIEPVAEPERWGMPASSAGISVIEPIAAFVTEAAAGEPGLDRRAGIPPVLPLLSIPRWPAADRNGRDAAAPSVPVKAAINGRPAAPVAAAPTGGNGATTPKDDRSDAAMRWPALSRVRSGLQQAPRED